MKRHLFDDPIANRGRNRVSGVENVVLEDDGRSGLACVVGPTGDGPHLATFHSAPKSETASTNS